MTHRRRQREDAAPASEDLCVYCGAPVPVRRGGTTCRAKCARAYRDREARRERARASARAWLYARQREADSVISD